MLCQKCNQKPATVFITQTVNNKTSQIHLCEECAGEQTALGGMNPFSVTLDPSSMLKDFFSTLFPGFEEAMQQGAPGSTPGRVPPGEPAAQCPTCGFQFPLFKQTGRLGCPQCYQSFASVLEPVITSIHGNVRQTMDVPKVTSPPEPLPPQGTLEGVGSNLEGLRSGLKAAVEGERFEEAARLRDEIRKLKDGPNQG
jgi:protein arginine kinase activator